MQVIPDFEVIELISPDGDVMVELDWIGEGIEGDFFPEDNEDKPLLRYTLYRKYHEDLDSMKVVDLCDLDHYQDGDWMAVNDGSYCTNLSAYDNREDLLKAAQFIMNHVHIGLYDLTRQKRLYETLSHIELVNHEPVCEPVMYL